MDLDLAELREMHPRLSFRRASAMVECSALALERNSHNPGVSISLDLEHVRSNGSLQWPRAGLNGIAQHDNNRITEDGAEVVALALAHRYRSWRVFRRMQREEHADWLLEDIQNGVCQFVALEVSGVDRGSIAARLSQRLVQVAKNNEVDQRWACVVGFGEPIAALHFAERQHNGN